MLDHDDLKWIASNATELNSLLQQVSRSTEQACQKNGEGSHLELLNEQVGQACKISQGLFDRITSCILSRTGNRAAGLLPQLRETPAPSAHTNVFERMPVGEVVVTEEDPGDPPICNPEGKRELILLVDDDPDLLESTGAMLESDDYRVILAKDGFEALRIYRRFEKEIALIILDYFLPVIDGDAVFDELKAMDPAVQVVLSSGFGEQTKLGSMLARGLRGFIPKPYTHEKLIEQIRLILEA